jgi:hypothetical protein
MKEYYRRSDKMGIIRLAKSLRLLDSLEEYDDRKKDINSPIHGNRVYMDFVSIVYKVQEKVAEELNSILFTFILIKMKILNTTELTSEKTINILKKYKDVIPKYSEIIEIFNKKHQDGLIELARIIDQLTIDHYIKNVRSIDVINRYVYQDIIYFIVDLLTKKIINVEYVVVSFDGIPNFGKIQEQRHRRYMRYAFLEFKKNIYKQSNKKSDKKSVENSLISARECYDNDHFEIDIRSAIDYVYSMYHSEKLQKDIKDGVDRFGSPNIGSPKVGSPKVGQTVVEVIDRPYGEGEKILMDKLMSDHLKYGDTKSYIFYSPDGDSVLLCLILYIRLKIKKLTVVKTYFLEPSDQHNKQSQYVDVSRLYNNVVRVIEKYSHVSLKSTKERDMVCYDFVMLLNFYGNDFIHQIPTMEISTTILDLMYIYSKHLKDNGNILENNKSDTNESSWLDINYKNFKLFLKKMADFEQYIMIDTYLLELREKNKIIKTFGDIFSFRYAVDFRNVQSDHKKEIYHMIKKNKMTYDDLKKVLSDAVQSMNQKLTVTGKKYGDIFLKIDARNISQYASKILKDPDLLLDREPRFLHMIRPKKNKNETEIRRNVDRMEIDLIQKNRSINPDDPMVSSEMRDFSFDYNNIRSLVPHNQMPTTDDDINIYMLEWKSGKWMDILNSYPYDFGYDWKSGTIRKMETEMRRYQNSVLGVDDHHIDLMVVDYLKSFTWIVDYYINDVQQVLSSEPLMSRWAYLHERSPTISHINQYVGGLTDTELKNAIDGTYKKSLVTVENYLQPAHHRFYIYPVTAENLKKIPPKYQLSFPNITEYVEKTVNIAKNNNRGKNEKVFDCRLCSYFSKCIFKSHMLSFDELKQIDLTD